MPILAKDNRGQFTPAPEGLHQAVCVDVIDAGLCDTPWGQKEKVDIAWQVDERDPANGHRFVARQRYTLSLNEKAKLRQHLEAWRGQKFTREELEGFDLERLLGVNCQIQIVHNIVDDGRVYANVQAVVPLGRGMTKIAAQEYVRQKDREQEAQAHGAPGAADDNSDDIPF